VSAQFIAFPEAEVRSILLMTPGQIKQFAHKKEIELFENSLAIGEENGDVLFIDKREENSKLYIFYPDGGDIEKTKLTLNSIIE
jgi:hypothetical protein